MSYDAVLVNDGTIGDLRWSADRLLAEARNTPRNKDTPVTRDGLYLIGES